MRVLVVSHLYPSTTTPFRGIFVEQQIRFLAGHGVHTDVLSGRYDDGVQARPMHDESEIRFVRLKWSPFLPSALNVFRAAVLLRRELLRTLESTHYDLVHAHYAFPDGYAAVQAAREAGIPVVVTLHGSDVNVQLRRPISGRWLAGQLSRADRILCVSPAMLGLIKSVSARLARNCSVVSNGYDSSEIGFDSCGRRDIILFVGGLTAVKNPVVLLEAFAAVSERLPFDLYFAGDGPLLPLLKRMVEQRRIASRVHFLGAVDHSDLRSLFARAVMTVLPSSSEGMPVTALESLASGVPLVCTPVGALTTLIDEENGILVPVGDVDALAKGIVFAAENDWNRSHIAGNPALKSWDSVASELASMYQQLQAPPS